MPELRKDPLTDRWVVISPDRGRRMTPAFAAPDPCPFCPGAEAAAPGDLYTAWADDAWRVRVVPNRYPALQVEGDLQTSSDGPFTHMTGIGAHEVIIESPGHDHRLADLPTDHVADILRAYRERLRDLARDTRLQYIQIFRNERRGDTHLHHPHSQLVALPMVPDRVQSEWDRCQIHHQEHGRCLSCDLITEERDRGLRTVLENSHVTALVPYAARAPFEVWILPNAHQAGFDAIADDDLTPLAMALTDVLNRIRQGVGDPPHSLVLRTTPPAQDHLSDALHWRIEVVPQLTPNSGFEWATGHFVNPVAPEDAAQFLREMAPTAPLSG